MRSTASTDRTDTPRKGRVVWDSNEFGGRKEQEKKRNNRDRTIAHGYD